MGRKVYVALVVSVVSQATLEAYLGIVLMILSTKYRPIDMKRIYLNHLVVRIYIYIYKEQLEGDEPY